MLVDRTAEAELRHFQGSPLDELIAERNESVVRTGVLDFFQRTAAQVPAYRRFLDRHGVDPAGVNSLQAFSALPLIDKANYLRAFPLPERCWNGNLSECDRIAVSSGSTGVPTFWPRSARQELDVAVRFEQVLHDAFEAHLRSTLAVVCFALGNWVGGMYTTSCCWHLANKGYPLTVATPGNRKEEIFRIVAELSPHFDQTVLLGYPPFVKDVIDAGRQHGIEWEKLAVKAVFAGEVFSEEWRNVVSQRLAATEPCYSTASLYGTADGGVLGNETPISIAARRFFAENPAAAHELFGESRLPTLVQYDPLSRYFERHGDTLVVTADSGIPLIRYHIADKGGIMDFAAMRAFLREHGCTSLADYGLDENRPVRALPFVWVFGRSDFTVSYYGANVYPENVTVGLEQPAFHAWVTGKFVLESAIDASNNAVLRIRVELLPGIGAEAAKAAALADAITTQLCRLNSEFANYVPPERQRPEVELRPFEDPEFFPAGVKHRYTRKT